MHTPLRIQFRNEMLQHRQESITLRNRFWRALCLFAFRQWETGSRGRPIGVPGERDPLFPCAAYNPQPRTLTHRPSCHFPDNHYLCGSCREYPSSIPHLDTSTLLTTQPKEHVA